MNTVGIDFGTTKTIVAYKHPRTGVLKLADLGLGSAYVPTTVYVTTSGEMLFGNDADDAMETESPSRYCRGFKMHLGRNTPVLAFFEGGKPRTFTAKQLATAYLRYLRVRCEEEVFRGERITKAVITCPVLSSALQRKELEEAAEAAGFPQVELVCEPEAAGYAFCEDQGNAFTGKALIVDWGGGTLDFALVSRTADGKVRADREHAEGNADMGGEVFDGLLTRFVCDRVKERDGVDLMQEPTKYRAVLGRKLRQYKERLSKNSTVDIRLSHSGGIVKLALSRAEFENLIKPDVDKAVDLAHRLVSGISAAKDKPGIMLLVGGTSGIPLVKQELEKSFSLPCYKWDKSRDAVALGAALLAAFAPGGERPARQPKAGQPATEPKQDPKPASGGHSKLPPNEALLAAARKGDELEVRRCLEAGALINCRDGDGWTPLMWAACKGYVGIVAYLVSKGAQVDYKNSMGHSAMGLAGSRGHGYIVRILSSVLESPLNGALLAAARKGDESEVRRCLEAGALINCRDGDGWTPLMWAACKGYVGIVAYLVSKGAQVDYKNGMGHSAMGLASSRGHGYIVLILSSVRGGS